MPGCRDGGKPKRQHTGLSAQLLGRQSKLGASRAPPRVPLGLPARDEGLLGHGQVCSLLSSRKCESRALNIPAGHTGSSPFPHP